MKVKVFEGGYPANPAEIGRVGNKDGNMLRIVTADSGEVVWCTKEALELPEEVSRCDGNMRRES